VGAHGLNGKCTLGKGPKGRKNKRKPQKDGWFQKRTEVKSRVKDGSTTKNVGEFEELSREHPL